MRPRFEDPIDSAKDMVEKNITLIFDPRTIEQWKLIFLSFNMTEWTIIAETMMPLPPGENWTNFTRDRIHETGYHAILVGFLNSFELRATPMEKWWKSREGMPGDYPYLGSLTARKWILNEVQYNDNK